MTTPGSAAPGGRPGARCPARADQEPAGRSARAVVVPGGRDPARSARGGPGPARRGRAGPGRARSAAAWDRSPPAPTPAGRPPTRWPGDRRAAREPSSRPSGGAARRAAGSGTRRRRADRRAARAGRSGASRVGAQPSSVVARSVDISGADAASVSQPGSTGTSRARHAVPIIGRAAPTIGGPSREVCPSTPGAARLNAPRTSVSRQRWIAVATSWAWTTWNASGRWPTALATASTGSSPSGTR